MKKNHLFLVLWMYMCTVQAQITRLGEDIEYKSELNGLFGDGPTTPFWQSANRYGLTSVENNSGYLRAAISRNIEVDSLRNWRIGYGADLVVPFNYSSKFIVQQLYGDFQYKLVRFSVGQKERPAELKNNLLSSGSMAMGTNARPIPQVRIELPDYWSIPGTHNWLGLKLHLAYGMVTDNKWQKDFNAGTSNIYTEDAFYHSKAGYLRVGNVEKFPLRATFGFEMVCQFGGKVYNRRLKDENGQIVNPYNLNGGIKDFFQAFIPTGSDASDGENPNVMGNQLGSYQARLDYVGKGWSVGAYAEHFFEDHSQLGWMFAWKDMLYGVEVNIPKNPVVATLLYEYMRTTDQSGPVFENSTHGVSGIGGVDDYYNHGIYGTYHHAGFLMGSPLAISPVYNTDGKIYSYDNRVVAHHVGICGQPCREIGYRILFTHEKSWGTYKVPRVNPVTGDFFLAEATYTPHWAPGLGITASYGQNSGELLGKSKGGMLTISYRGWINHKK